MTPLGIGILQDADAEVWKRLYENSAKDRIALRKSLDDALRLRAAVERREGMMEVYDWTGRYAGCVGVETWQALVMEAKAGAA